MNELAGQQLGGYQLEEEVGRGSMGVVYRSKQLALGREVAVKILPQSLAQDSSYVARFIRETQIIAGLNHPNIVHIYDAGQHNALLYFAMEYVQGPTLASLIYLDGIIPPYLAVEYAAQIADALDAAYRERNVIHRDIKPENLMLNRWGKIKVMDFGLARAPGLQPITMAQTLVGSIYYSSPEQIWGQKLDNRSDIYALGTVLYEMVTGHRPFTGKNMPELTQAIIHDSAKPPRAYNPEITSTLEHIIQTSLAKDKHQRYEDAGLMAQALRALQLKSETQPHMLAIDNQGPTTAQDAPQMYSVQPPNPELLSATYQHPPHLSMPRNSEHGHNALQPSMNPDSNKEDQATNNRDEKYAGQFRSIKNTKRLESSDLPDQEQQHANTLQPTTQYEDPTKNRDIWKKLQRLFSQSEPEEH